MKYVAAAMLVQLSGKTPDKKNVKKVLQSVDADVDDAKLFAFLDAIEGKNIKDLIASGLCKLSSVPTGAVSGGGAPAAGGGGGAGASGAAKEEKKEEAKEEPEEESDDDMGFGLFD